MQATNTVKRNTVDIDTRRAIISVARGRKPVDVNKVPHEQFIRNALKDKMGWPRNEPAPESIKAAAKQMAATLVARDKEIAEAKAKLAAEAAAKAAKEAAEEAAA
jgi:hypothetical protein